jgi:CysZ protein
MGDKQAVTGLDFLKLGFSTVFQPGLKRFVFIPITINVIVYAVLFWFAYHMIHEFILWSNHFLPRWLEWLDYLLWPLFIFAGLIFLVYTFTMLANIICAPFNSFLSEKIELMETGKKYEGGNWQTALKAMPRAMHREWCKIKYYLPRAIILAILCFIPGINIIAAILWFVFGSWMMAVQYLDYPMDNHHISFKDMMVKLRQHLFSNWLFGAAALVASMIPILNLIAIPASVAGGTLKYLAEHHRPE